MRPPTTIKVLLAFFGIISPPISALAQGIVMPGIGPLNQSMGGAATGAPLGPIGALHWNPASISAMPHSEISLGGTLLTGAGSVTSFLPENSFGAGIPSIALSGRTRSDSGVALLPTTGFVYKPDSSDWTWGVGVYAIGGLFGNLSTSVSNPIVTPSPPVGFGSGGPFVRLQLTQVAPTVSYQLTDTLAIGFAPTVTIADFQVDPLLQAAPDDANGDGFATYPTGIHNRPRWGGGFQVGLYGNPTQYWSYGVTFKSPQWFEDSIFRSEDEIGRPRAIRISGDYPMIVSMGAGYRGIDRLLIAVDLRYTDYDNTEGFERGGFNTVGALRGVGWNSGGIALSRWALGLNTN